MKLGDYEIPEIRLMPNAITVLDEIYSVKQRNKVLSKDLAIHLGFKYGTESYFYRKLKTLLSYGLLEGKGSYQVSELGESLLQPRTDKIKEIAKTKAILNVELWKAIKEKVGKIPREGNFWSVLVDITKVDPNTAKKEQAKILKWYLEDIELISEDLIESELNIDNSTKDQHLSQGSPQRKQEPRTDVETIFFDKYEVTLPKGNLSEEWEILKSYMDIKLKNYKYEELIEEEKLTPITENPQEE
ncbi:MAG: hypothetical protein HRU07_06805 [Nitrosopumilus sp.]|nr:hypothetical protein [Nitrosopumilus sp.]NRA05848.1 hypothetical protein [Nitrosopumilus sp.]